MKKTYYLAAATALALAACSENKDTTDNQGGSDPSSGSTTDGIASIIVTEAPENPKSIHTIKKTAKAGDTLTVQGKVMGREDVFVPGRAIMILGDPKKLTSCDLKPDDHCITPWDVCCDEPETIKESTLTVQVVDKDGRLVKSDFKGVAGIKELSELTVTGVVAEGSNQDNLILNATAIHVKK